MEAAAQIKDNGPESFDLSSPCRPVPTLGIITIGTPMGSFTVSGTNYYF